MILINKKLKKELLMSLTLVLISTTILAQKYKDGRPDAILRMDAKDHGIVLRYGDGPNQCDILGAQDEYDAAAFSSVVELSEWSVRNNSNSIKVPDFTAGAWKTNKPNMDINLGNGSGNTKVLW